jgi:hypothetical protein
MFAEQEDGGNKGGRIMRLKIKYALYSIGGGVLALLLIILLPIDDALDAEAAKWLESANDVTDVKGNAYYFLMGMGAVPPQAPEAAGRKLVEEYLRTEQEFREGKLDKFPFMDRAEPEIPLPEGKYYCPINEPGCFTRLVSDRAKLEEELATYTELLQRYYRFLQFDILKPLLRPSVHMPFPLYSFLIRGQRLHHFKILRERFSGGRERALMLLQEDIGQWRKQLAAAPGLIEKLIALKMLANDLDLLFNAFPAERDYRLPALTTEERSFQGPMIKEFAFGANLLLKITPGYEEAIGSGQWRWLARPAIKTNMTVNNFFIHYKGISELSLASPAEFNAAIAEERHIPQGVFNLRNIGGSALVWLAVPQYAEYIARIHDVDCKLALLNAALGLDEAAWNRVVTGAAELAARNPYNPESKPFIDSTTHSLCFDGPFEDAQKRRCIRRDY